MTVVMWLAIVNLACVAVFLEMADAAPAID